MRSPEPGQAVRRSPTFELVISKAQELAVAAYMKGAESIKERGGMTRIAEECVTDSIAELGCADTVIAESCLCGQYRVADVLGAEDFAQLRVNAQRQLWRLPQITSRVGEPVKYES